MKIRDLNRDKLVVGMLVQACNNKENIGEIVKVDGATIYIKWNPKCRMQDSCVLYLACDCEIVSFGNEFIISINKNC